ncbi:MAG: TolC family outer membrane protein [Tistlia sp.]|uniref:TolC family outer membrane protein n=1 Tax=Tistlia sp. TaxID=3057121 RepID=UPI0034A46B44
MSIKLRSALMPRAPFRRAASTAVLACALLAGLSGPGSAQSLIEALSAAYETNPTLLGARSRLRAVNESVPQALGGWRPSVEFKGAVGYARDEVLEPPAPRVTEHLFPRKAELAVTQPLIDATVGSAVAGAEDLVRAQRAVLADTEQTVLLRAAQAYVDVAQAQESLRLRQETEQLLAGEVDNIERRLRINEATVTDLDQTLSRLAGARADTATALAQLNQSRKDFRLVTGIEPGALPMPGALGGLPAGLESAVAEAREANPNVIAAGFQERAAREDVARALGSLYPTLGLTGSLTQNHETLSEDSEETIASVGLAVTVPLYQQGVVSSGVREAKETASQRRLATEQARRDAEQSADQAWQSLTAATSRLHTFREQVDLAYRALEGVRREYRLGDKTVDDLLDQIQELKEAELGRVAAERDEVLAGFQLLSAVGRLHAGELGLPVALYDPELDYRRVRNAWFGLEAAGTD